MSELKYVDKDNSKLETQEALNEYIKENGFFISDKILVSGGSILLCSYYVGVEVPFKLFIEVQTDHLAFKEFKGFEGFKVPALSQADAISNHSDTITAIKKVAENA